MKQIINGKLYDTDNSEIVYVYLKNVEYAHNIIFDCPLFQERKAEVYRTKKGNYFLYITEYEKDKTYHHFKPYIEDISERELKEIISRLNPHKYIELFGMDDIEEA